MNHTPEDRMHCNKCRELNRGSEMPTKASADSPLSGQFCEICGHLLPVHDTDDGMLRKLTQLARFGLDGESHPILVDSEDL